MTSDSVHDGPVLGAPVQIAYATDDVHAAALQWTSRGVGPFFVIEHIALTDVEIDGAPGSFDHSSAYGQWGSMMIELVQQHDPGSDPVVGTSGIHHIATFVDDFETSSERLTAAGYPRRLRATTSGGQAFGFHDARATTGHLIEIYEATDRLVGFYAMIRDAAAHWDGSDPVRTITSGVRHQR